MICDLCNRVMYEYDIKLLRMSGGELFEYHRWCRIKYLLAVGRAVDC